MTSSKTAGAQLIAEELEHRIMAGTVKQGEYLSSVRSISKEFGCAPLTAHRALKHLVERGLAVAEPRHGYRVTSSESTDKGTREIVAFLEDVKGYEGFLGNIYETQLSVLRRGSSSRGWASVVLPYEGQTPERIEEQLREMGATALILQDIGELFPADLAPALGQLELPTVSLDMACSAPGIDMVLRDEAHGAAMATEYLVARGHRNIGWYGPLTGSINGRKRYSGAAEVLLREGISADALGWREVEPATDTEVAREYLERPGRPTAVLALWQTAAMALARAAAELGLRLGEDLEIVGWSLEEHFEAGYAAECPVLREKCATVTWSMADVGVTILSRIEELRRCPDLPDACILLPMKLVEPRNISEMSKKGDNHA